MDRGLRPERVWPDPNWFHFVRARLELVTSAGNEPDRFHSAIQSLDHVARAQRLDRPGACRRIDQGALQKTQRTRLKAEIRR